MSKKRIVVIGGGAGGMIAAGRAAELGGEVVLLEKMERPGKKILISGKTRCNLTNTAELEDFIKAYGENGRFLYSAFSRFFREDLLALMNRYGVETEAERGGRIFPASGNAEDVVRVFERYMAESGVKVKRLYRANSIRISGGNVLGVLAGEFYPADAVILATGGASFPATGSTGDGYRMAAELGHTMVKLRPALVPLVVQEVELAQSMQGVSLRNVRLTSFRCSAGAIDSTNIPDYDWGRGIEGKKPHKSVIESRFGEMMMTHFGIGGPISLQMSLAIVDALENGPVSVSIDLKPALSIEQLRLRLQRDFDNFGKQKFRNIMNGLLPLKLIEPFVRLSGIPSDKLGGQISAEEKERLLRLLKSLRFNITQPLPIASAMVTAGGVSLKEIDPRMMESKLVKGLFFCGEVMDVDADTGGFNLQAAFSTGYVAGESAAREN